MGCDVSVQTLIPNRLLFKSMTNPYFSESPGCCASFGRVRSNKNVLGGGGVKNAETEKNKILNFIGFAFYFFLAESPKREESKYRVLARLDKNSLWNRLAIKVHGLGASSCRTQEYSIVQTRASSSHHSTSKLSHSDL